MSTALLLGGLASPVWPWLLLPAPAMRGGTCIDTRCTLAGCLQLSLGAKEQREREVFPPLHTPLTAFVVTSG